MKKLVKSLAIGFIAPDVAGLAGQCGAVAPGGSSEDVRIDRERGFAYLSVLNRASLAPEETVAARWRDEILSGAFLQHKVLT